MAKDASRDILLRLRRIEGQIRGIQRMIEDKDECSEILNQVAAVKSAVNRVSILIFENHARDCIQKSLSEPDNEERFKEIITLMGRLVK